MRINGYIDIKGNLVLQARDKEGKPVTGTVSRALSQGEIKKIQEGIQKVVQEVFQEVILADPATKDMIEDLRIQGEINIQQQ